MSDPRSRRPFEVGPILGCWLVGALVAGVPPAADARSGQADPGSKRTPGRPAESREEADIPAPRKIKVATGRGKASVYPLDPRGERLPDPDRGVVGRFLEVERELHWAAVTGVIDHWRIAGASIARRPSRPISPERLYHGVDLERQARRADGTWSDWERVDRKANLAILDNLPAIERERVSQEFLAGPLVDPLPWLRDAAWEDVDVEEFLPPGRRHRQDRRSARPPPPSSRGAAPPLLMFRTLDLTAEPGRTYRYRARIVLHPPERMPGTRRDATGTWSGATDAVTIPRLNGAP